MTLDMKSLGDLIKSNQGLVDQLRSSTLSIQEAADSVEAARMRTSQAIRISPAGELDISFADEGAETTIMGKIADIQAAIDAVGEDGAIVGALRVDLATQFLDLANLPNASVASIITFSDEQQLEIARLIEQAKLDTAQRRLLVSVLNAAVGLAQVGLKVAAVVAA